MNLYLRTDDWEAIYLNGSLVTEGHKIGEKDLIKFGFDIAKNGSSVDELKVVWLEGEIGDEFEEEFLCNLPNKIEDFPTEVVNHINGY